MTRVGSKSLYLPFLIFSLFGAFSFACDDVVPRSEWNARPPKWVVPIDIPVKHVMIAHTVTPECYSKDACASRMREMQNYHMSLGWSDIGYTYAIGGDGRVYEGVGWKRQGIHTLGWNDKSHGIAFIGNFQKVRPNDNMLRAARKLLICGIQKGAIADDRLLHGARDATCTESPGDVLYEIIKKWPRFEGGPIAGYRC